MQKIDRGKIFLSFTSRLSFLLPTWRSQLSFFFQQYKGVIVSCSGGADSVALFHILCCLNKNSLAVLHVNYGLRGGESDEDEAFVKSLCKEQQVVFFGSRIVRPHGKKVLYSFGLGKKGTGCIKTLRQEAGLLPLLTTKMMLQRMY